MPEPLKNSYTPRFFETFIACAKEVMPAFDENDFLQQVFDEAWQGLELKQRMRHIAQVLHRHLPVGFRDQTDCIIAIVDCLEKRGVKGGFEYMFLPDFIEQYGLHEVAASLKAMERMTQFVSCEFAIRPFLINNQKQVMKQMLVWSRHPHHHVRRFASEGCRPRLPWAMAIPGLKKDPSPIFPLLENLKADDSLFVRKSVANNLNDIAKDHPDLVAELVKNWKGESEKTDWIIRHGCRTLLKQAHPSTYELYGLDSTADYEVSKLELSTNDLKLGDSLRFSFRLKTGQVLSKLRLEYAIYYKKATGKWNRKIFQITEKAFAPGTSFLFEKEQRFHNFTTRKHYPGKHKLAIVVNGKEVAETEFLLLP